MSQKQSLQHEDQTPTRRTERKSETPGAAAAHPAAVVRRARLDPKSLTPHDVLQLQRTVGNRAVGQLLSTPAVTPAPSGPTVQRAFDKELKALGLDAKTMNDPLLQKILAEVLGTKKTFGVPVKSGPSLWESEATRKDFGKGKYETVIDPTATQDPLVRQSYILHELMHVSADRRYAANQPGGGGTFENLVSDDEKSKALESQLLVKVITDLDGIVNSDNALDEGDRKYIQNRVGRMSNSTTEMDTVASELLYYITKKGLDHDTDTYKAIHNVAEWTYRRRQTGLPVPPPANLTDPPGDTALPDLKLVQPPPKQKKKGCFITTACVTARGLPDDCEELTVLRAFRDGYMRSQADGPALIAEYYRRAPAIVAAIQARDDAAAILERLFEVIQRCVRLVQDGQHPAALETYRAMALRLQAEYAPAGDR